MTQNLGPPVVSQVNRYPSENGNGRITHADNPN
jgi:hypothetical protein